MSLQKLSASKSLQDSMNWGGTASKPQEVPKISKLIYNELDIILIGMLYKGPYNSKKTEPDILKYWLEGKFFKPEYHAEKGLQSDEEFATDKREAFSIINPPPNAYMRPHIGNVSGYAYQDIFLRYNRMKGKKVLGQPGKDHAGIQGEVVLEKIFWENKKKTKQDMGREKFYKAAYSHFTKIMPKVMEDEQRIGLSSDYDRNLFTLDPKIVKIVLGTFKKMFDDKMVYKGVRIVNWDPVAQTTLADIDTERVERETDLVYINYPFKEKADTSKVKVIIFDLNKVLFTTSLEKYEKIGREFKVSDPKKWREYMTERHALGRDLRLGKISNEEFWTGIGKEFKIDIDKTKANKIWYQGYEYNEELAELISSLREKGYKIGLFSNNDPHRAEHFDKKYGFLKLFDYQYWSYEEGSLKPDLQAYENLAKKFDLEHEEILFIDDKMENLIPAEKLGWKTFHYQNNTKALEQYIQSGQKFLTVATTRAETMLGDTAVVVHPEDERYKELVGKKLILPLTEREIPVITSPRVEKEFGTGAVKLTPAHSYDDYVMMNEWNQDQENTQIGYVNVIDKKAKMTGPIPKKYKDMTTEECRNATMEDLKEKGLIEKIEKGHRQSVMIGERSKAIIEQIMSSQWFIDVEKLKGPAIDAAKNGDVKVHPEYMKKKYLQWMENLHDWPVSRSLWWGYRIPVWYKGEIHEEIDEQTGQIVETIDGEKIEGIYDAVEKGLAKVEIGNEKQIYLVPGKYGFGFRKIFPEIQRQYKNSIGLDVQNVDNPRYEDYEREFKKHKYTEQDTVIAHSLGTRATLKYILDNKIKLNTLILLAPASMLREKDRNAPYYDLIQNKKDYDKLGDFVENIHIIYSDNDEVIPVEDFREFVKLFSSAKTHEEKGRKHYAGKTEEGPYDIESPALLEILRENTEEAKITVIRHGQTDHNTQSIYSGRSEISLNENGVRQLQELAEQLKDQEFDLILSSPIKRTLESTEILSKALDLPIETHDLLKEKDMGEMTGLTWEEFEEKYPEIAAKNSRKHQPNLEKGESTTDVEKRVGKFLEEFRTKYSDKKVLIMTHVGIIRILRRKLLGQTPEESRKDDPENAYVYKFPLKAQQNGWIQDKDVFDTWFSSGQWVYATLIANDLMDEFYPTDIMETMHDILELWVSRMMMLSLYTQGEIPFKNVYLHGMVKAPDGQKMSKSKGNVISPEEIIDKYGADSLRLMYLVGNKAGASYPVSYEKLEGYKRFLNKIWNASKFVLNNTDGLEKIDGKPTSTNKQDQKLLEELAKLSKDVTRHIDEYRIGMAADQLYQHFWHYFCDICLEEVKPRLYTKDKDGNPINQSEEEQKSRTEAQATLLFALKEYLKMLHPFIPFITEFIWQETDPKAKTIMYEKWN